MTYIKINTMNKYNITYYSKFKYNYTYCIICTNKKSKFYMNIYFGQHRTNDILDGYIGSGTLIRKYLRKYTNDFYKVILSFYSNEYELNKAEIDLIKPHLGKEYCLNISVGGGSYGHIQTQETREKISKNSYFRICCGHIQTQETREKISNSMKGIKKSEEYIEKYLKGRKCSEETREKIRNSQIGIKRKPHDDDTKQKISASRKGKKTMYKENDRKYVDKDDFELINKYINEGWSFIKTTKQKYNKSK